MTSNSTSNHPAPSRSTLRIALCVIAHIVSDLLTMGATYGARLVRDVTTAIIVCAIFGIALPVFSGMKEQYSRRPAMRTCVVALMGAGWVLGVAFSVAAYLGHIDISDRALRALLMPVPDMNPMAAFIGFNGATGLFAGLMTEVFLAIGVVLADGWDARWQACAVRAECK